MANVNTTNSEDRLDRSIRGFENSMHNLAEHIGETRGTVEDKVQRAKDTIDKPRQLANRAMELPREWAERAGEQVEKARYRLERNPFPFLGVAFGVGLLLGMQCASWYQED